MTAPHIIDPAGLLGEALSQASPDLMRSLLQHVINALLSADADTVCGGQWGRQDPQHHAQRNGQRHWPWTPWSERFDNRWRTHSSLGGKYPIEYELLHPAWTTVA